MNFHIRTRLQQHLRKSSKHCLATLRATNGLITKESARALDALEAARIRASRSRDALDLLPARLDHSCTIPSGGSPCADEVFLEDLI